MARPDKHEKQRRRARETVDSALRRGRLGEAVDALLELSAEERSWALPSITKALATERGMLDLPTALAWLPRVEREPRLLPQGEDGTRIRWALFVAALRARQWSRARSLLEALRPALETSPLLPKLRALVAADGRPDPGIFLTEIDHDRARLGYDDTRRTYPCPGVVDEVEPACIGCFGREPWHRFREVVAGWLKAAAPPVAHEVRRLAVLLSQRELVSRGREPRSALEVARFAAILSSEIVEARAGAQARDEVHAHTSLAPPRGDGDAPAELEPVLTTCVGVAARALAAVEAPSSPRGRSKVDDAQVVDAAATIARAALRYPSLASAMAAITLSHEYGAHCLDAAERLLRIQIEQAPTPALLLRALALRAARPEERGSAREREANAWLLDAFEQALEQPVTLAGALAALARERSADALEVFDVLPIRTATAAIERLWSHGDDAWRDLLARTAEQLYARMKAASVTSPLTQGDARLLRMLRIMAGGFADDLSDVELRRYLRSPDGRELRKQLGEIDALETPLSPAMEALWRTIEERVVPFRLSLLEAALERCAKPPARRALARQFWARRPTLLARIETLHDANGNGFYLAEKVLRTALLSDLQPEPLDAARALLYADASGAPSKLCSTLARALVDAMERAETPCEAPELTQALRLSARFIRRRAPKKSQSPAKKRQTGDQRERTSKQRAHKRGGKKTPARVQLDLAPLTEGQPHDG